MMANRYVAVYGTLMKGEPNEHWREGVETVTEGVMFGTLYDTGYGYPAFVPSDGDGLLDHDVPVECEVLRVDDRQLANMDVLEGYPRLYRRERIIVHGNDDKDYVCLVYVMNQIPAMAVRIGSGRWRAYADRAYARLAVPMHD